MEAYNSIQILILTDYKLMNFYIIDDLLTIGCKISLSTYTFSNRNDSFPFLAFLTLVFGIEMVRICKKKMIDETLRYLYTLDKYFFK